MSEARPVLKWVGGKTRLLPEIQKAMPKDFGTYFEPFLGGGSVLFSMCPSEAVVNDINEELMNLYAVIRDNPDALIEKLRYHEAHDSRSYYYSVRDMDKDEYYKQLPAVDRAARMVYLNKTCFNGLYRVSTKGFFNAPYGNYIKPPVCDEENIQRMSQYFNTALVTMCRGDFEASLSSAKSGDFVYLDPPLIGFNGYSMTKFTADDQERLKDAVDRLSQRGVKVLMSNFGDDVARMYKGYKVKHIEARRSIGAKRGKWTDVDELLIRNY